MSKFVLTAQLQLQAPTNAAKIISKLRKDLSGVKVPVTVTGAAKAKRQIKSVAAATKQAGTAAQNMGKSFGIAFKRFAAFTIASRAVSLFTNGLANAVDEAIDFQREMIKISQVTGKTITQLQGLERTIFSLATSLGVSSKELLSTTRVLSQAGIKAKDLDIALAALAKTTLAPTFENIAQTAEGAIAILAQFKQGVGALESQLGSINAVAGQFAVEAGDIIGAIRRTGGVFKEAGGSLSEFIALFTSVRATTRESSESIATGLRTIFTRIQRPKTLEFLRQYGVELTDLEGRFVGPYEAVRRLNKAVGSLEQGDITFIKIAEEIAGFRQIGKVIPLLKEFELSERAKNAALEGGNSLAADAAKAQKSLAVQIMKVKQEFQELIQGIANSTTFQAFVKTSLNLASALIKVADSIKPLIPLIAGLAAIKFARGLGGFASGIGGALKGPVGKNKGGKILAFARGGMVPGQGSGDTVPAMLQPGEFVMRKSSVNTMGADNLAAMNSQKFALGGKVGAIALNPLGKEKKGSGTIKLQDIRRTLAINNQLPGNTRGNIALVDKKGNTTKLAKSKKETPNGLTFAQETDKLLKKIAFNGKAQQKFSSLGVSFPQTKDDDHPIEDAIKDDIRASYETIIPAAAKRLKQSLQASQPGLKIADGTFRKGIIKEIGVEDTAGKVFEGGVSSLGAPFSPSATKKDADAFDFAKGIGGNLAQFKAFASLKGIPTDAKKTIDKGTMDKIVKDKTRNFLSGEVNSSAAFQNLKAKLEATKGKEPTGPIKRKASGGAISGSDTVPALLTPGEFVLNKGASKSIGYGNLGRMNKSGVAGFNKGGVVGVGVQRFAEGGGVGAGTAMLAMSALSMVNTQLQELGTSADGTKNMLGRVTDVLTKYAVVTTAAAVAIASLTGQAITMKAVMAVLMNPLTALKSGIAAISAGATKFTDSLGAGLGGAKFTEKNRKFIGSGDSEEEVFGRKIKGKSPKTGKRIDKTVYSPMGEGGKIDKSRTFQPKSIKRTEGSGVFGMTKPGQRGAAKQVGASGGKIGDSDFSRTITKFGNNLKQTGPKLKSLGSAIAPTTANVSKWGAAIQGSSNPLAKMIVWMKLDTLALKAHAAAVSLSSKVMKSGFMRNLTKGFKSGKSGPGGNLMRGKGLGGKVGRMGGKLTKGIGSKVGGLGRMAMKIPGVGALGGMASGASAAAGGGLAGAAAGAAAIAGPVLAVVGTIKLLNDVTKAMIDVEGQKKDAIIAGNESEAGRLAAMQNLDNWLLGGFQQGIVSLTHSVAGMVGGAADFILGTEGAGEFLQSGITHAVEILTGDWSGSLRKMAVAQAAAADASLKYADRTRTASRALEDVKSGRKSASEAFGDISKNLKVQGEVRGKAKEAEEALGEKSTGLGAFGRNVGSIITNTLTLGMMGTEFAGTKNARIDEGRKMSKDAVAKFQQEFDKLRPGFQALGKELILGGGSLEDFKQRMEDEGIMGEGGSATEEQQQSLIDDFKRQADAIKANIAYIESLNFGLRDVTAAANAAAVSMDTVAAAGTAGFNSFEDSAKILEASVTAAGANIGDATMDGAIEDLESSMRKFGASESQISETTGTVKGLRTAQGNTGAALAAAQEKLKLGQDVSPDAIKDALRGELLKGVEGPAKEKLAAAIDNMKIDEEMRLAIASGDLDKILEKTIDPVAKAASEQALALLKKRADLENKLITSIKNRQQQEVQYIAAQKKAIDTQLEAGKLFESFGGAKLTSDDKLGARIGQANLDLGNAGVGGLGGGSAREIKAALEGVRSSSARQNDRANFAVMGRARGQNVPGAFEGAQGLDDDKRDELKTANQALVAFTKQRITLIQEELKIAQQKNKAEKDSLDKLLGGDIAGFLEGQLAAAAGAALKMGDAGVASAFGAGALGAGFKTLEGQGLSDSQMQNAASLSLSSVGVTDPRSAEVLSETTAEQEALKTEGRELSQILGDAAQQGADLEQMDVNAANVVITASKVAMNQFEAPGPGPAPFSRGGPVYANRGMFVPRGSDTIPAMLTPGEFVVNRSAVAAGNNLSLLTSMNGGAGGSRGMGMSKGGMAYMAQGGLMSQVAEFMANPTLPGADLGGMVKEGLEEGAKSLVTNVIDPMKKALNDPAGLKSVFNQFDQSVQKLMDFQLNVKVDPTNVTVNFQGSSFLAGLKDSIRNELLEKVREELKGAKFNESGDLESRPGGMA
jgi:hypothetical protein